MNFFDLLKDRSSEIEQAFKRGFNVGFKEACSNEAEKLIRQNQQVVEQFSAQFKALKDNICLPEARIYPEDVPDWVKVESEYFRFEEIGFSFRFIPRNAYIRWKLSADTKTQE